MESESRPYIVAVPVPLPQAEDSNTTPAVPSPDPTGIHVMMTSKLPSVAAPPAERTLAPLPDVSIDPPSPPFILNSLASPAVLQPATTSRFAGEFAFIDQTPGAAQVQDMSQPFFTQAPLFLQPGAQSQVTNIPTTQSATIPTSVTITSMSSTSLNLSGHSSTAAFVGNSPAIAMLDPATLPVSSQNQQAAAQAGVYLPIPFLASIIAVVIFGAIGIFLYRQRKQVIEAESKNAVWSAPLPYRRPSAASLYSESNENRLHSLTNLKRHPALYSMATTGRESMLFSGARNTLCDSIRSFRMSMNPTEGSVASQVRISHSPVESFGRTPSFVGVADPALQPKSYILYMLE